MVRLLSSLILLFLASAQAYCQASSTDPLNAPQASSDFLGWDPSVDSDVLIRHRTENQPIIFSTDGVDGFFFRRMEY